MEQEQQLQHSNDSSVAMYQTSPVTANMQDFELEEQVRELRYAASQMEQLLSTVADDMAILKHENRFLSERVQTLEEELERAQSPEQERQREENEETPFHHFHGMQQALMRIEHDLTNANEDARAWEAFARGNPEIVQLHRDLMLMEHDLGNAREDAKTWKAVSENCPSCVQHCRDLMKMEHDLSNALENEKTWKSLMEGTKSWDLLIAAKDEKIKELEAELFAFRNATTHAAGGPSPTLSHSSASSFEAFTGDLNSVDLINKGRDELAEHYEALLEQYRRDLVLAEHEIASLMNENSTLRAAQNVNSHMQDGQANLSQENHISSGNEESSIANSVSDNASQTISEMSSTGGSGCVDMDDELSLTPYKGAMAAFALLENRIKDRNADLSVREAVMELRTKENTSILEKIVKAQTQTSLGKLSKSTPPLSSGENEKVT